VVFHFQVSRQKTVRIFLQYSCHIPRPDHSPWFDDAKIFREQNKSWSSPVCNILQPTVTCSLLGTLFSSSLTLCCSHSANLLLYMKQLTSVRAGFLKTAWLKIQVFCDVALSHWVSGYHVSKNRTAFAFSGKQSRKDGLFTSCLWRRRHHDPSTGLETHIHNGNVSEYLVWRQSHNGSVSEYLVWRHTYTMAMCQNTWSGDTHTMAVCQNTWSGDTHTQWQCVRILGLETLTQWQCVRILATSVRTSQATHSEQVFVLPTSNTGWIQRVERTLPIELAPRTWTATPPEPRQPRRRHRSSWGPSRSSPAYVGRPFPLLKHKFEHPGSLVGSVCVWGQVGGIATLGTAFEGGMLDVCVLFVGNLLSFFCEHILCRWRSLQCRFWSACFVCQFIVQPYI